MYFKARYIEYKVGSFFDIFKPKILDVSDLIPATPQPSYMCT